MLHLPHSAPPSRVKIDAEGHYTLFPGVTVICPIRDEDKPFWSLIYQILAEEKWLLRYFSPLPLDSYHMTALNLFTEALEGGNDWGGFLSQHRSFLHRLKTSLDRLHLLPVLTIEKIVVSDVIQLYGHLPAQTREDIVTLARQYDLEHKIPRVFHMTLAYRYQKPADECLQTITHEVSGRLESLLQRHSYTWPLKPAALYSFNDMTAFTPWDAPGP